MPDSRFAGDQMAEGVAVNEPAAQEPFHRLAEIGRSQGITRRTVARLLNIDVRRLVYVSEGGSDNKCLNFC